MSARKNIDHRTLESIQYGWEHTPPHSRCGCQKVGDGWYLCQYHEGYEDAAGATPEGKVEEDRQLMMMVLRGRHYDDPVLTAFADALQVALDADALTKEGDDQ